MRINLKILPKGPILLLLITIISKLMGFAREVIIAGIYGATVETDAYFLSASMPGIIFPAICTSLSVVFVSQYTRIKSQNKLYLQRYTSNVLTYCCGMALCLSFLAIIIMPLFVNLLAPGFDHDTKMLTIFMSRCTLATFIFMMLRYILNSIMNIQKRYVFSSCIGLLNNVVLILSMIFLYKKLGIYALLLGYIVSEIFVVVVLFIFTEDKNIFRLNFSFSSEIKELVILTVPVIIGNATVQITEIIDKIISSYCDAGSVTALSYSITVYSIVVTAFSLILDAIFYPHVTDLAVKKDNVKIFKCIRETISAGTFILLPTTIIMIFNGREIIKIIYERGLFTNSDTVLVSKLLGIYSLGILFVFINCVYKKVLYSNNNNKLVMKSGFISMFANVILSIAFYKICGIYGIALGTLCSNITENIVLTKFMKKTLLGFSIFENNSRLKRIIKFCPVYVILAFICKNMLCFKYNIINFFLTAIFFGISMILFIIMEGYISNKFVKNSQND